MKKTIIFLAIIFLSSAANAQLKSRDFQLENEDPATFKKSSVTDAKGDESSSANFIELNKSGIKKALEDKDYQQAIGLFQKAFELEPQCYMCLYNVGRSFIKLGKFDDAIEVFKKVVENQPDLANAQASLGEALSEKRKFSESLISYQNALKINSKDPITLTNYSISLSRLGNFKDAMDAIGSSYKIKTRFSRSV